MSAGPADAVEARPWRESDGPEPRMHVFDRGRRPRLRIHAEGRWRTCTVQARMDWPDGRIAYHVEILLRRDGLDGMFLRAYWWDPKTMRPAHGTK